MEFLPEGQAWAVAAKAWKLALSQRLPRWWYNGLTGMLPYFCQIPGHKDGLPTNQPSGILPAYR
jgi:hypothetical protein